MSASADTIGCMLLARLVEVSTQVAATRSRLTKRDLIADLLRETAEGAGAEEIDIAASYLSGTLRQRRTGVGWRGLAEVPAPADEPSVTLTEVDSTLEEISVLSGSGSAGARRDAVGALFGRLTEPEQDYLRNLVTGNVRQGALDSVMLDAIAAAADLPVASVRRAAMFSAPTGPIAVAALTRGRGGARGVQHARRPAGPADAGRHGSRRGRGRREDRRRVRGRHQARRHPDPGAQARRRGVGVHPQPRRDLGPAARGGRCHPCSRGHRPDPRRRGARPRRERPATPVPGDRVDHVHPCRRDRHPAVLLRPAPPRGRLADRGADPRAARPTRLGGAREPPRPAAGDRLGRRGPAVLRPGDRRRARRASSSSDSMRRTTPAAAGRPG